MKNIVKSFLLLVLGLSYSPDWSNVIVQFRIAEQVCENLDFIGIRNLMILNQQSHKQVNSLLTITVRNKETNGTMGTNSSSRLVLIEQGKNTKKTQIYAFGKLIPGGSEIGKSLPHVLKEQCEECAKLLWPDICQCESRKCRIPISSLAMPTHKFEWTKKINSAYGVDSISYKEINDDGIKCMSNLLHLMYKAKILEPFNVLAPNIIGITEFKVALKKFITLIQDSTKNNSYEVLTMDTCEYVMEELFKGMLHKNREKWFDIAFKNSITDKEWKWFNWQFDSQNPEAYQNFELFDQNFCSVQLPGQHIDQLHRANLGISLFIILYSLDFQVPASVLWDPLSSIFNSEFTHTINSSEDLRQKILSKVIEELKSYTDSLNTSVETVD